MVIKDHFHVIQSRMKKEELLKVKGGTISAAILNAISRGINTIYNLGVAAGSAIRRATKKKICY